MPIGHLVLNGSTGYDNWNLPSNYLRIKNEEIANWIKKKVQTILAEVEEKHISM